MSQEVHGGIIQKQLQMNITKKYLKIYIYIYIYPEERQKTIDNMKIV